MESLESPESSESLELSPSKLQIPALNHNPYSLLKIVDHYFRNTLDY